MARLQANVGTVANIGQGNTGIVAQVSKRSSGFWCSTKPSVGILSQEQKQGWGPVTAAYCVIMADSHDRHEYKATLARAARPCRTSHLPHCNATMQCAPVRSSSAPLLIGSIACYCCVQTNSATQANVGRRLRADSGLDLSQLNANVANQANVAAVNNIGKDNTGIVAQVRTGRAWLA